MTKPSGRKQPLHLAPVHSWDRAPIIFVTACSAQRKPILASPTAFDLITSAWRDSKDWIVGRFVIMPEHTHFFCTPTSDRSRPLEKWMQYWKALVARQWPRAEEKPIWQRSHWDRQLRREESYSEKWEYVRWNPVRHKLVERPEDWPYQGEMNELMW
jgi:REP element-mobilizing transposase RayT